MKQKYTEQIDIPEGVSCEFAECVLKCKLGEEFLERKISIPGTAVEVKGNQVVFHCEKAKKNTIATIKSNASHVRNMFQGLKEKFVYELEICHVHFPMTVKLEDDKLIITNFLGEKVPRTTNIPKGVDVKIQGEKITVSSVDIELAGHAASSIEKVTKVSKRDRRVFQDGIFITSKPGGKI